MAKSKLASLINVNPNSTFVLASSELSYRDLKKIKTKLKSLQQYGLIYRPELREYGYQSRIDEQGVKKEILMMLPGLSLVASTNYNSNNLLYHHNWEQLGVKATWNLVSLIQGNSALNAAKTQVEITRLKRLAQSAAVLAQISISYNQYKQSLDNLESAEKLNNIERQILAQTEKKSRAKSSSTLDLVLHKIKAINASLDRDKQLIETRTAYNHLVTSMGIDLIPGNYNPDTDTSQSLISNALYGNIIDDASSVLKNIKEENSTKNETDTKK